jgi:hypothetical protein
LRLLVASRHDSVEFIADYSMEHKIVSVKYL